MCEKEECASLQSLTQTESKTKLEVCVSCEWSSLLSYKTTTFHMWGKLFSTHNP